MGADPECTSAYLECSLGSVSSTTMEVCHRGQLGVYMKACFGVCMRASWKIVWESIVKQGGSGSSSAIGSELECVLRSVLEGVLK